MAMGGSAVSTHAPTQGATRPTPMDGAGRTSFNPRAHAGRDLRVAVGDGLKPARFNPRAHAGRDAARRARCLPCLWVSTHAPTQGATGGDDRQDQGCRVSTHAPTQGATDLQRGESYTAGVSTHAPTQGATPDRAKAEPHFMGVSTHAPTQGATQSLCIHRPRPGHVSTHAPTQGATRTEATVNAQGRGFNPRAHAGRDGLLGRTILGYVSFNPRAHAGRDRDRQHRHQCHRAVSTHAPTQGATRLFFTSPS